MASRLSADLDQIGSRTGHSEPQALTIPEVVERASDLAPWVIPGLLRSDWRAVVVASEGVGKSTLLRQLAMCAAQGVHPLTHRPMDPVRTFIIDAENPLAAIAETGGPIDEQLRRHLAAGYEPDRCRVWSEPGGLDLRTPSARADLVREIRHQQPGLVVAGPIYKLGSRHEKESYEDAAEGLQLVLDDLRTRFGFALVLEHHAPKPQGGKRELLPFGSQRWLAWPELGITLTANELGGVTVGRFRGDRLHNWWPETLERGGDWPFTGMWEFGIANIECLR